MKFGINTFLFTAPFTDGSVSLFSKFKAWGFDSVEIALENASDINPAKVKEALNEHQLTCNSICAAMGSGRDFRGSQREQTASMDYLKGVLDVMPVLGANVLAGPLYSTVGRAAFVAPDEYRKQWDLVVDHLQSLASYAGSLNITLAVEPLNRYETDFINTCSQALELVAAVGSDHLKIHLDSYHMNIEEKDLAKAIL
ncbi:MAG TPA: sugar phosphate isomerase/epimerase, partial [Parapedobacter sp.]|nr:sugar phosphate isomerase/epimerase [Parapedobacter sp.]